MSISLNTDVTVYQGTELIITCTALVMSMEDAGFDIAITWTSNPPEAINGPYVTITDTSGSRHEYSSTVTIIPVNTTDSATYTCTATGSSFIMFSMESSDTVGIEVEGELNIIDNTQQIM